jgi:hypothetical protein
VRKSTGSEGQRSIVCPPTHRFPHHSTVIAKHANVRSINANTSKIVRMCPVELAAAMRAIRIILILVVGFPFVMFLLAVLMGSLLVMRLAVDASRGLQKTAVIRRGKVTP